MFGKIGHAFKDIWKAIVDMPKGLRRIWWVKLFSWYGLPFMWQYLSLSIARHSFNAPTPESPNFAEGSSYGGIAFIVMNVTTVVMAFLIPSIVTAIGTRMTYAAFLICGGIGFISMMFLANITAVLACMVGVGIAWSAIITIPFIMTTSIVSAKRIGVYMGLLNAFICIPQIFNNVTAGLYYDTLLEGDPRNALVLCGICFILAAAMCLFITRDVEPQYVTEGDAAEAEARGMTLSET